MSKQLRELLNSNKEKCKTIIAEAKAEERAMSEEELAEFEKLKAEIERIKKTLKIEEEEAKEANTEEKKEEGEGTQEEQEKRAFEDMIRGAITGKRNLGGEHGAVIGKTIASQIITKVYDICPILNQSTKYNVKGDVTIPYYDETSDKITVAYSNEFQALVAHDGEFKSIELTGFLAGALAKVSNSLVNNADFDLVGFVVNQMAEAIARFVEHELLVGTSGKVEGLSKVTNKITAASATEITADEIVKLKDAIKDVHQPGGVFIMSSATRTALRLLKDENGRYLLQDDISKEYENTMLGKPVYISDSMPDMAAKKNAIYYGDMACVATKFGEDMTVQVLSELFAAEHATGVIGWVEFDGKLADASGVAVLTMANS